MTADLAMGESGTIHSSTAAERVRQLSSAAWYAVIAGLFLSAGQVVAAQVIQEVRPTTELGSVLILDVVDDSELGAIYGKGYQGKILRTEVAVPVILWDEGKRKIRINEIRSDGVIHGNDLHRYGAERSR